MKFLSVRNYALSLHDVAESPHHHFGSFRVRGRIFATFPPAEDFLHVFVSDEQREQALALYPSFAEKLVWGGKVAGLRLDLSSASATVVKRLIRQAWETKAANALPR